MIALLKFLFQANNKISHLLNLSNAYLLIMQDEAQALCFVLQCPLPLFCLTMSIISFHFCYTICAQVPSNCTVITLRKTLCIFVCVHTISSLWNVPFFLFWDLPLRFISETQFSWKTPKLLVPWKEYLPCALKTLIALTTLLKFFC